MVKKKKIKAHVGDIFSFCLKENFYCFGQIISESAAVHSKLYILFDFVTDSIPDIQTIVNKPILAIAHLDDSSIEMGEWKVIGVNEPALKNIKYPNYLIHGAEGPEPFVINYYDMNIRLATAQDILELDFPTSYTSNIFELLAKAKYIDEEYGLETFKKFLFNPAEWTKMLDVSDKIVDKALSSKERLQEYNDEMSDEDDFTNITICYNMETRGFGTLEDLEKRDIVEGIINRLLSETRYGNCDAGEIGNGQMFIYCRVKDSDKALGMIRHELNKHHLLDGAIITI
jgi:hypothetical protein